MFPVLSIYCKFVTQDGRPTTPSRPRTSPGRRPGSSRPGIMTRPKTAAPVRVTSAEPSERADGMRERPSSARDRPMTSMGMRSGDEGGMADVEPPVVTIETPAAVDPQSSTLDNAQDMQA